MFEVKLGCQESDRQPRPTCCTDACASATCRLVPKRSLPTAACPDRFLRAKAGAKADSIYVLGIRSANTSGVSQANHLIELGPE